MVMINGVSGSVHQVQADGSMANGVSGFVAPAMTNGVSRFVSQVVADGGSSSLGEVASEFWERMQLEDVERGTRALLMMEETQAKIHEKARFILNLKGVVGVRISSLAREINGLCVGLTARIEERECFIDELDILVDSFVPEKMAEFLKETQEKDRNRLMRLQILGREFELRADEKNQFMEKLKGNVDF
ncbi:hypothetical protein Tco_0484870 [Tanacetum coccineum]